MSAHHQKHHHEGDGVKLIGTPIELIDLVIPGDNERKWAIEQIDNEGPKHKQVFSALLLNRLFRLVRTIEKNTGTQFELQNGYELFKESDKNETALPIELPINLGTDLAKKEIADAISHAPEHELLVYATCLQVVEWAIKTTDKKIANN